eukprot:1800503-Rhodomonas_salina.2
MATTLTAAKMRTAMAAARKRVYQAQEPAAVVLVKRMMVMRGKLVSARLMTVLQMIIVQVRLGAE